MVLAAFKSPQLELENKEKLNLDTSVETRTREQIPHRHRWHGIPV